MTHAGLVALVICGVAGGVVGIRCRVPLGGLLGSIVGAGGYQLLVAGTPALGRSFALVAQVLVGSLVGAAISRPMLRTVRSVIVPALVFSLLMPAVGLAVGWLLMTRVGHVDLLTAYLSSAPAGAMEMSAAALAVDADAEAVLAAQVLRVLAIALVGSTLFPIVIRRLQCGRPPQVSE
jgi:membrane AbrB-like protein